MRSNSAFIFSVASETILCFSRLKSCSVCEQRRRGRAVTAPVPRAARKQRGTNREVGRGPHATKKKKPTARRVATHFCPNLMGLLLGLYLDEVHHLADLPRRILVVLGAHGAAKPSWSHSMPPLRARKRRKRLLPTGGTATGGAHGTPAQNYIKITAMPHGTAAPPRRHGTGA